jgi:ATP-dependent Clp protease ATP-binding subunit ClpB
MYFKPLTRENISAIVELSLLSLTERLAEKQLSVTLTESAKAYVIEKAYDPIYGARPLKRFISANVETLIARLIIAEDIAPGSEIIIDYEKELTAKIK